MVVGLTTLSQMARIIVDPAILSGKPLVRGTRLSVAFVIGLLADGWSEADILASYPNLEQADILACLAYARDCIASGQPPADW